MVNDVPEVRVLGLAKLLCLAGLHAEHDPQPLPHAAGRGERVRLVAQRSLPAAPEAAPARSPPEDSQVEAHCLDDEHARPLAGQPHRAGGAPGRSGARGYGGRHIGDGGDQPLEPSGPQEAAAGLIADALRSGQRSPDRAARGSGETVVGGPAHVLKAIDVGKRAEAARHEARGGGAPLLELLVDYEPPHQDDVRGQRGGIHALGRGGGCHEARTAARRNRLEVLLHELEHVRCGLWPQGVPHQQRELAPVGCADLEEDLGLLGCRGLRGRRGGGAGRQRRASPGLEDRHALLGPLSSPSR
mmetsp:Transcript_1225/g.3335  ORF Transcript_1225/g.3335 Transcript_1225/m.3335 type:complete len:301 (-) Transcript_1225:944-1846(-)